MNNADTEYFRLLNLVLYKGRVKKNRTGIDTLGIFGAQARFDLSQGFPLLTTKKVHVKAIIHELLWFLSGSTNIKYLVDNDVKIWNEWAYKRYKTEYQKLVDSNTHNTYTKGYCAETKKWILFTQHEYIEHIKGSNEFAEEWGELGEGTYGGMWRGFPFYLDEYNTVVNSDALGRVDQIQKVIDKLKTNPDDRRLIVSAWHPYWVDHCALPPCHALFQFHTEELTQRERYDIYQMNGGTSGWTSVYSMNESVLNGANIPKRRLNCQLYQRSCDLFLGVPFNIASYALLTQMMAHVTGMVAGEFIHTYGDLHLYTNHLEQVKLQLSRAPQDLPIMKLNPEVNDLFKFKYSDFTLESYDPHPAIKAEVAV